MEVAHCLDSWVIPWPTQQGKLQSISVSVVIVGLLLALLFLALLLVTLKSTLALGDRQIPWLYCIQARVFQKKVHALQSLW